MEITAMPRPRAWPAVWGRAAAALALLLVVGLLFPAALGLQWHVVTTDEGDAYPRGSVVFGDRVAVEELAAGDVVIDQLAGGKAGLAARTILHLDGHGYRSRSSGVVTSHGWRPQPQRVAFAVPVLGYPALLPGVVTVLLGSLLALAVAAPLGRAIGGRRTGRRKRVAHRALVAELQPSGSSTAVAG